MARAQQLLFEMGSDQVEAINAVSGDRCNPHPHVFSDRLLRPGDQAFFDVIHSFMGYRTCYYRTFNVGGISQSQLDAYKQCREWLDAAIDLVRPGTTTDEIAAVWPTAEELGFPSEESCFGLQFGHGVGVGLYEPPMISRVHSFECPQEIEEGMVFALETYCAATDGHSAARIEEEVVVTKDGYRILTRFPAEELLVAGKTYVRGADLLERETSDGMSRYRLVRREEIQLEPGLPGQSSGLSRQVLVGGDTGATHTGLTMVALEDGYVNEHLHSYESSFYVFSGNPVLYLDGRGVRLEPDACGAIPVGVPHAFRSEGRAEWVEMLSPRPRGADQPPDTFFLGPPPDVEVAPLDLRDPRNRNLFHLSAADMDAQALAGASRATAPTVSASMATAALLYSGITVKMLVDKRLDAQLHTMFMVGYQPGAVAHPHDHPFEESYVMLEGEVDVVADGDRYTLRPGDVFWTGVGCIHAFYETSGGTVKWLETSAPGPARPALLPVRARLGVPRGAAFATR